MNNPLKKYVRITTNLPKGIEQSVIGTPVTEGEDHITVGKIIAYDKETGKTIIRLKSAVWKKIAGKTGLSKDMYNEQKDN